MEPRYFPLAAAIGSIQANDTQREQLDEITEALAAGEFHTIVDGYSLCKCIDGRYGGFGLYPNAAGGTETLMVADDLTAQRYGDSDTPTVDILQAVIARLESREQLVGGHSDEQAGDARSGCGAHDRLADIYSFIANHSDRLRSLAESLGVAVDDALHERITDNASRRVDFSNGADMTALYIEDEARHYEVMRGAHAEVAAVVNLMPDTTFSRDDFERSFGEAYQAFNIDAWAFEEAASQLYESPQEIADAVAAMAYFNFATAHVLCGPQMRVIVLQ